ncbi:MAG: aconitate hydratase [Firmicutes bacterium]|nr:aconitate hydratase [Bacillota bacterium]
MGLTIAQKIIKNHMVDDGAGLPRLNSDGVPEVGEDVAIRIDQTLTQDATGTMAYLEFETMGIPRVRTELSVAYIDHNTLQSGFENADDHRFIQSMAAKYGLYFSRPGNGICHQVHLERFAVPGKTLIGSDSHTPTAGGIGMLAMGAGGLDVAVAMGGGAYHITMPKMYKVNLTGKLRPFVTAKDVSLEILRILSVKGGVGNIIEWGGAGVKTLSVPERATITNMGAELGATTSIFPADEATKEFLAAQGRGDAFKPLASDEDAIYDRIIDIDLASLEPMIACPHSPDNVVKVSEVAGTKVDQVCVGSCTNSSLLDMLKVAAMLRGKTINSTVSLSISPGSKQVLRMLSDMGALSDIIASGARILECSCGPCIGMGFSPNSGGVSLRTFNRNFEGRSGTKDANVYLVSPETAVASALMGFITNPLDLCEVETVYNESGTEKEKPNISLEDSLSSIVMPDRFTIDDSAVIPPLPEEEAADVEILRGPNIKEFPKGKPIEDSIEAELTLKVGDNITTDHIMPAGSKILPYRSNIPHLSQYCFEVCDATFPERAKAAGSSIIVGGSNYGQGSSREHAALVPLYLGVRAVVAKSFARIHVANLINAGIIPLTFENPDDYDRIFQGDTLVIDGILEGMDIGTVKLIDESKGIEIDLACDFTERQREILKSGGLLPYIAKLS